MPTLEQIAVTKLLRSPQGTALREAIRQESIDYLVPKKQWHTPVEVAGYIGMQLSHVYELLEGGKLGHYAHNAASDVKFAKRIPRAAVVAYLLSAAKYEPADHVARIAELIDALGLTAATLIATHAVRHRDALLAR